MKTRIECVIKWSYVCIKFSIQILDEVLTKNFVGDFRNGHTRPRPLGIEWRSWISPAETLRHMDTILLDTTIFLIIEYMFNIYRESIKSL